MTTNENGPQVLESPRDREDQAAGGSRSAATVAHPLDLPQLGVVAVLADDDLYVVPNPMFCTGLTTKGKRCSFQAWPRDCGEWAYIVSRVGVLYAIDAGPGFLTEARVQRCDLHEHPRNPGFCAPEIELFHQQRHAALVMPLRNEWVRL